MHLNDSNDNYPIPPGHSTGSGKTKVEYLNIRAKSCLNSDTLISSNGIVGGGGGIEGESLKIGSHSIVQSPFQKGVTSLQLKINRQRKKIDMNFVQESTTPWSSRINNSVISPFKEQHNVDLSELII